MKRSESFPVVFQGAVEGIVDEAVLRRLVSDLGAKAGNVYGKNGKDFLRRRIRGYNNAARFGPWVVIVDLDDEKQPCAPPLVSEWLPTPSQQMCFRVAVREIEAWLLADRERISKFLAVALSRVPTQPESLDDPKQALVNLARCSRRRDIREDMVPREDSGRKVGSAYDSRLIEFVIDAANGWRPDVAAQSSDSLRRCMECIRRLMASSSRIPAPKPKGASTRGGPRAV